MAASLGEGAGLGEVFERLFRAVLGISQKLTTFSSSLNSLKSTLASLKPIVDDLEKLNMALDRPQQETDLFIHRLREGERLVAKGSKMKSWELYKKYSYSKKISDLEDSIMGFFGVDVQALLVRDTKQVLVELHDVDKKVDKVLAALKNSAA